jgi:hypothetical protein
VLGEEGDRRDHLVGLWLRWHRIRANGEIRRRSVTVGPDIVGRLEVELTRTSSLRWVLIDRVLAGEEGSVV